MKSSLKLTAVLLAGALAACGHREARDEHHEERETHERLNPATLNPAIGPQSEEALEDPRARIFLVKGCPQCHSIAPLHVTSPTNAGPDLSLAPTDVHTRFNTSLEEFLKAPTGTMQIVLGSMIQLSPAERDSVVRLLNALNAQSQPSQGPGVHP